MSVIHHTRTGAGAPALIFIHAFGCARSDWDAQVVGFSSCYETVAVDLGGHGTTPAKPDHIRVEAHAEDVLDLMSGLDLRSCVIVGNSLGCRIALEVASRAPARTRAVVLVDGSRLGSPGITGHAALGNGVDAADYRDFVVGMFAKMFSPAFDPPRVSEMTRRAQALEPGFATRLLADVGRHDCEKMDELLAAVRVPLLAIQSTRITPDGQRISLSPGETSPYLELLKASVPGVAVNIIANSGHYPQIEQAHATNAALKAFLQSIDE
ncbi:MAG: pimeloyl-ACP methyl ester carboxylesterase [Gammaproteobacteria bacterium]|jgi:pimeloyl-ACP methyl ester carboxylesterase